VLADEAMPVTLALEHERPGQGVAQRQGSLQVHETRTLDKDTDKVDVTLAKGQNVLVLKVINEVNNWQGCARFLRNGAPVTNIKIAQAPQ
jgi:hypothetical protein